jgi:hypothetical protein
MWIGGCGVAADLTLDPNRRYTSWTQLPDAIVGKLGGDFGLYEMNVACKHWKDAAFRAGVKREAAHWKRMMEFGFSMQHHRDAENAIHLLLRRGDNETLHWVLCQLMEADANNSDRVARNVLRSSILRREFGHIASEEKLITCFAVLKNHLERAPPLSAMNRDTLEHGLTNAAHAGLFHVMRFWLNCGYWRFLEHCLEIAACNDEGLMETMATIINNHAVQVSEYRLDCAVQAAAKANKVVSVHALLTVGSNVLAACLGAAEGDHVELLRNLMPALMTASDDTPEGRHKNLIEQKTILSACISANNPRLSQRCLVMLVREMGVVPDLLLMQQLANKGHVDMFRECYTAAAARGMGVRRDWLTRMLCASPSSSMMQLLVELGADATQLVLSPAQHSCMPEHMHQVDEVLTTEVASAVTANVWDKALHNAIANCNSPTYVEWLLRKGALVRYDHYACAAKLLARMTYGHAMERMTHIMALIYTHLPDEERMRLLQQE